MGGLPSEELLRYLGAFCDLYIFAESGPESVTEDFKVRSGFSFFAHALALLETVFPVQTFPTEDGSYLLRGKAFSTVDRSDLVSPDSLSAAARASK